MSDMIDDCAVAAAAVMLPNVAACVIDCGGWFKIESLSTTLCHLSLMLLLVKREALAVQYLPSSFAVIV